MGRKAFLADLQAASETNPPPSFSSLKQGDEDGTFTIDFTPTGQEASPITLQSTIIVDDYPIGHSVFVYVVTDGAPKYVENAMADASQFDGLKVSQVVSKIAKLLREATAGSAKNPVSLDSDDQGALLSGDDGSEDQESEDEPAEFDDTAFGDAPPKKKTVLAQPLSTPETLKSDARARSDFRLLKQAGFHVSCQGSPFNGSKDFYVTVSCRIAKLNISEDAINAWGLVPEQYFLLIIHYSNGYRSLDQILEEFTTRRNGESLVKFRTAVCTARKASRQETVDIFSVIDLRKIHRSSDQNESITSSSSEGVRLDHFFMDRPLNELLNGHFLDIVRARYKHNFSWSGAENFCQDHQAMASYKSAPDSGYYQEEPFAWKESPFLAIGDHFAVGGAAKSFPLIAMEFTLRHLVHCTDFCLVCHTRLEANFEALKPYVCSKPLCLYQYMALGFGPSMEHELLSQPYVVDLLISFCFARSQRGFLKDLPVGLGFDVPDPTECKTFGSVQVGYESPIARKPTAPKSTLVQGLFDQSRDQLLLAEGTENATFKAGDWIALRYIGWDAQNPSVTEKIIYRRINDVLLSTLILSSSHDKWNHQAQGIGQTPNTPPPSVHTKAAGMVEASVFPLNQKFDNLDHNRQQQSICLLLDALPSVLHMKDTLKRNRNKSLAQIYPDVPPAAFSILRWIIASNRSCIVAIDDPSSKSVNIEERVNGMSGYMQFRFAQGAPDKEQRFVAAVKHIQTKTKKAHPTIWAWHGSPLHNWHSIIREGLHYNDIANGRAYGNGVYHALDCSTSLGYAGRSFYSNPSSPAQGTWKRSVLLISSALSLNEIVNAPDKFQSKNPYLVVQHVDWIQTRYLFVQCATPPEQQFCIQDSALKSGPTEILPQDPDWTPTGENRKKLVLPCNAISSSRYSLMENRLSKIGLPKRQKVDKTTKASCFDILMSDVTDDEDIALVESPNIDKEAQIIDLTDEPDIIDISPQQQQQQQQQQQGGKFSGFKSLIGWKRGAKMETDKEERAKVAPAFQLKQTDFIPGSLDLSTLQQLPSPPFATPAANKALSREVKALQKTQSSTSPGELGWYLCEAALDNIYQWIVELHSFDPELPLHKDLKSKGLTSVVLELRFGPQFPFSPPFVRVVRPRFLDFRMGGGGHVTAGGAMCMQLLTNDGWSAASSIEAVLLQVRLAISSTDPQPARLPPGPVGEYSAGEAIEAYKRACMLHGWTVPPDFKDIESQRDGRNNW